MSHPLQHLHPPKVATSIEQIHQYLSVYQQQKIALVPTMGNLHPGHIALAKRAKACADVVIVSIFVNPTQFGVGEDFDSYPRTLDSDLLALAGVADIVFAPSVRQMYPSYPPKVAVTVGELAHILCGRTRPTHFDGVGLVVTKLFNIIRPNIAIFGKKDYQQLAIIRTLNAELNFNIDIIGVDIVRDEDGLALSSRNQYLTTSQRQIAPLLYQTLQNLAVDLRTHGLDSRGKWLQYHSNVLTANGFLVDYLTIYNQDLSTENALGEDIVLLVAAKLGKARLLDNLEMRLQ